MARVKRGLTKRQRHKKILSYVKEKVYAFADKYNLYVNKD